MNLSELLKKARDDRSFRYMQRKTGISHTYLYQLENGVDPRTLKKKLPSLETLKTLSETLHIDFAELLASVGFNQMLEIQEENKRLREALEEISALRNYVYPTEYVFGVESLARKALEGDKQ